MREVVRLAIRERIADLSKLSQVLAGWARPRK
jgi:hypothetical protein